MSVFSRVSTCCRFNHELVFGVSVKNLSKAERLIYGDSLMTHAMILTAVTDKVATQPEDMSVYTHSLSLLPSSPSLVLPQVEKGGYEKWRVENSWGDDRGNKGNNNKRRV